MSLTSKFISAISPTDTEPTGTPVTAVLDFSSVRNGMEAASKNTEERKHVGVVVAKAEAFRAKILADGRVDDVTELPKLQHCQLTIELGPAHIAHLEAEQPKLAAKLERSIREGSAMLNKAIRAAGDRMWSEIVDTNEPYFPSMPRKKIERELGRLHWPKLAAVRKAAFTSSPLECRGDLAALVAMADALISSATRSNKSLKLGLEIK